MSARIRPVAPAGGIAVGVAALVVVAGFPAPTGGPAASAATAAATATQSPRPDADGWTLTTTETGDGYAPTFLGNGYFGGRIPAAGMGYERTPIETQAQLAGFFAQTEPYEQRANIPTWSTLAFSDGSGTYGQLPASLTTCAFGEVCQAEDGRLSGGTVAGTWNSGWTGTGFVAGYDHVGASTALDLKGVPSAGTYTIAARAANFLDGGSSGDCLPHALSVYLNGTDIGTITFPETASWNDYAVTQLDLELPAGDHTLALKHDEGDCGRIDLDYVSVSEPGQPLPAPSGGDGKGTVSDYRQTLDMRQGLLTTQATWTSPEGNATDLSYQVLVHRARQRVAAVQLTFTPHWTGSASVTGMFDGTSASRTKESSKGYDAAAGEAYERVTTLGTDIDAGLASRLELPTGVEAETAEVGAGLPQSVGEQATFDVASGRTYTVTKYVGVASSQDSENPLSAARAAAADAADTGYRRLLAEHTKAWAQLWRSDIEIKGDPGLQSQVRASMFYLLESTRAGVNWSLSPGGLSSDGYSGHVFWDAETWMYPALVAQHPDIAVGMHAYRQERLDAAKALAAQHGFEGAQFPWESALKGDEQTPPCCEPDEFEHHITADVALGQWQHYLVTGDRGWLAEKAWPVLKGAAEFWAGRAEPNDDGSFEIHEVQGPDEYHYPVNNSVYTNVAAAETLRIATRAAKVVGAAADPEWGRIADGLRVPFDEERGIHPEFDGYEGDTIKQADVVMLQYPWEHPMPAEVAQNNLDYYAPRTDPNGPSMTDSIHAIDTAELGTPGCASYYYMQRSVDPFMRGPFNQFSEARHPVGAFTFVTGNGGFLQEFLYGFSGMRWRADRIDLDPMLPPQLDGVTLRRLQWQGRTFDVAIGPRSTTVTLTGGRPTTVDVAGKTHKLRRGTPLTVPTRRPDLEPTSDVARCAAVTASSVDPSYPAIGAVDGSEATTWQPKSTEASLQVDLGSVQTLTQAKLTWAGTRASDYTLAASTDGETWHQLAEVTGASGTEPDQHDFPATKARYLRLSISATPNGDPAALSELITGRAG